MGINRVIFLLVTILSVAGCIKKLEISNINTTGELYTFILERSVSEIKASLNEWDEKCKALSCNKSSMLRTAMAAQDAEQIQKLLKIGANPNLIIGNGKNSYTLLGWAIRTSNTDLVINLIEAGADVNAFNSNSRKEPYPIFTSVYHRNHAVMEILIKSGADLDVKNMLGSTPLLIAAYAGNWKGVWLFLEHGADPNSNRDTLIEVMLRNRLGVSGEQGDYRSKVQNYLNQHHK